MLDRQPPSKDSYIAIYFEYFDQKQIEKIDYDYKGAIGGIVSSARVQFKGPVKLSENVVDEAIKNGKIIVGTYDPAKMSKDDVESFKHQWTLASDGEVPSWLDFPFDKKMRKIKESRERKDTSPGYDYEWYIDDDRNVVYLHVFVN
jgi:hypothetical protein